MTEQDCFLILNAIPGLGYIRIRRLLEIFKSAQAVFRSKTDDLKVLNFLPPEVIHNIVCFPQEEFIHREREFIEKNGIDILTFQDPGYPENLKTIAQPPAVLYVKGRLETQHCLSVAVVGSRRASYYGLSMARQFARDLVNSGITIVSGLARGIDAAAHQGALDAGGQTLAVLGSGLGCIYPFENRELSEKISHNGAVISEFPAMTEPRPGHFPKRNRIISGLSLGVLVVEASRRSGALITSDFALEQGREVFAVPGKVGQPQAAGVNHLIQQGAKLVSCVEDILEEIQPHLKTFLFREGFRGQPVRVQGKSVPLERNEQQILNLLKDRTLYIDDIARGCQFSSSRAVSLLLSLELKKEIQQLPGKRFMRVNH